ncbi:carbohydrate ABC transporter membrane protein 1, CUT1 family [Paenibacillaceae bacterium GAS479]|nr:carbohydrate ABC transporter membrane protein 1, CUT1 family [Paenibacillaceae bacterium GAS479]
MKRSRRARREELTGWLMASPWIIGFLFLTLGAMTFSLGMSFTDYDFFNKPSFVGLQHYKQMLFEDELVWHSIKITTLYAFFSVPLTLVFGLLLAMILNQKLKGIALFRTVYYFPSVLPEIATIFLWILVFDPSFGLFNSVLKWFSITGPNWLGSMEWALPSFVIMSLWGVGGGMLIYLAGLQGIPTELYEAATVDGSNRFTTFMRITLPMLSPVIFFNLVMGIIGALQVFNQAYIMTNGGPARSTYFFMLHIFYTSFQEYRMAYASALSWLLFLYIGLLTFIVFRFGEKKVFYS